jgi:hypothetical protein
MAEGACGVDGQGGADLNILLQLPHVDHEALKRMARRKVRSAAELAAMRPEERLDVFIGCGAQPLLAPSPPHARSLSPG